MQLLATAEQMQEFDRSAIKGLSIPGLLLMENAGRSFVDLLECAIGPVARKEITVLCGKGNNGGDGFVIARHCAIRGAQVVVTLLARPGELKGDAAANFAPLKAMAANRNSGIRIETPSGGGKLRIKAHKIVIDAIFGTGLTKNPAGIFASAIRWANSSGAFIAAVDIPSGVNGSTGAAADPAIRADMTVAMGLTKIGHYLSPGRELSGNLEIGDIGVPPFLFAPPAEPVWRVLDTDVARALPRRPATAHKYSVGKVFVLGGSRGFTGAPSLAALAALRSGAGAVVLGVPASIHPMLVKKLTEVILLPLPETAEGTIAPEGFDRIAERCSWADVVALGPGLGRNSATDGILLALLKKIERPVVLDADGLTAVAGSLSILGKRTQPTILTPHAGELGRLIGVSAEAIESRRVDIARDSAKKLKSVLVLKGSPTVTSWPRGPVCMNSTGNPGMATIGSGDVLTGVISGFAAQGMPAPEAAWAGVYIHGKGGDIAAGRLGQRSLLASDILDSIPEALQETGGA
jgi:NAD(P)H-hydrate epimerase